MLKKYFYFKNFLNVKILKRKDIQEKYSDPNMDYYALYENIAVAASNFQSDISEKDHFFFEYQKFWCPRVSYHMVTINFKNLM